MAKQLKTAYLGFFLKEEQKEAIVKKAEETGRSVSSLILWELRHIWEDDHEMERQDVKKEERKENGNLRRRKRG